MLKFYTKLILIVFFISFGIDVKSQNLSISGETAICLGQPYEYTINSSAIPDGYIAEWSVTGGTLMGSDWNTASVQFTANPSNIYQVNVYLRSIKAPYCPSNTVTLTAQKKQQTGTITTPSGSFNFCPSTTATFKATNLPAGYEAIEWEVIPAEFGSIGAGQNSTNVSVSWHEVQNGVSTGTLRMKVKLCGTFYNVNQQINLNANTNVQWANNTTSFICGGTPTVLELTSPVALSNVHVDWLYNEVLMASTTNLQHSFLFGNLTNDPINVTVKAVVTADQICGSITLTHEITITPAPSVALSPAAKYVFCGANTINVPLTATIQNNFTNSVIHWYKLGNTTPFHTGIYYTITGSNGFGTYYVEATNEYGCTSSSNLIEIVENCTPPCPSCPNPPTVTAVKTGCNTINLNTTDCGDAGSEWLFPAGFNYSVNGCNRTLTARHPGVFYIQYKYVKNGCYTVIDADNSPVIVPYIADLRYEIHCGNNGQYSVTLHDNSEKLPQYAPEWVKFYISTTPSYSTYDLVGQNQVSVTQQLPAGTYYLTVEIGRNGFAACVDTKQITLAPMPNVNFTLPNPPLCQEGSLVPQLTVDPDCEYKWVVENTTTLVDFTNLMPQPNLMPGEAGDYTVTLTVTNKNGCSSVATKTFQVFSNDMRGTVSGNTKFCKYGSTVLTFTKDFNSPISPTSYQWMRDNIVIPNATGITYTATQSGSYWVVLTSSNGCKNYKVQSLSVFAITVPQPTISAPDKVCLGDVITLIGNLHVSTQNANYEYRWLQDDFALTSWIPATNAGALIRTEHITSDRVYHIELRDLTTGCTVSYKHPITVLPTPATPDLAYVFSNDNPYTVKIGVLNYDPNFTYLWSNGESGDHITVSHGGVYKVWVMNPGGCSSEATINIPYDPAIYLWIFPSGCHEACYGEEITVLGPSPLAWFDYYSWNINGYPHIQGGHMVPDYYIYKDGCYSLTLENRDNVGHRINRESDPLCVQYVKCEKCEFRYERKIEKIEYKPYIIIWGNLVIYNPYPFDVIINVTLPNGQGALVIQSVVIPAGGSAIIPFMFVPDSNFAGTVVFEIEATSIEKPGFRCVNDYKFDIKYKSPANPNNSSDLNESFYVIPNPASDYITISYSTTGEGNSQVTVYNLQGQPVWSGTQTGTLENSYQLNINNWVAGHYVAVWRKNGEIVKQTVFIKK